MNPFEWTWLGLLFFTVAYWLVTAGWWILRQRQKHSVPEPDTITRLSEGEILVTFEDKIDLVRAGLILVGPPMVLFIAWLIGRH